MQTSIILFLYGTSSCLNDSLLHHYCFNGAIEVLCAGTPVIITIFPFAGGNYSSSLICFNLIPLGCDERFCQICRNLEIPASCLF